MKYLRTLAVAVGLALPMEPCISKAERQYSVDISKLESLSGEIVKVESRQVACYQQIGDVESVLRTTDVPCWYTLISVQSRVSVSLAEYAPKIITVAVNPRRNEGKGLELMTPPLAVGTLINGMKYYPSPNGKVHEKDIASIIFSAFGTRASAHEIQADGIVHPLY